MDICFIVLKLIYFLFVLLFMFTAYAYNTSGKVGYSLHFVAFSTPTTLFQDQTSSKFVTQ